jgi:hypothetical protein
MTEGIFKCDLNILSELNQSVAFIELKVKA